MLLYSLGKKLLTYKIPYLKQLFFSFFFKIEVFHFVDTRATKIAQTNSLRHISQVQS